jgi:hypothetical protein
MEKSNNKSYVFKDLDENLIEIFNSKETIIEMKNIFFRIKAYGGVVSEDLHCDVTHIVMLPNNLNRSLIIKVFVYFYFFANIIALYYL